MVDPLQTPVVCEVDERMCFVYNTTKCDLQATMEPLFWVQCGKCKMWRTLPAQPQVSTYAYRAASL